MLSHERVWAAIDALAERYSLSASGLAKRAGLDSTAFNKSKRQSSDGRPRWPSTESLAKIIEATGSSLDEFLGLVEGKGGVPRTSLPQSRCLASRRPAPEVFSTMPGSRPGRAGTWWRCRRARMTGRMRCRYRVIPCCLSIATAMC